MARTGISLVSLLLLALPIFAQQSTPQGYVLVDTRTGTATAPATGPTLAQEATTGGSITDGTYYCVWTGVNLNGETTASPQTSIVVSAGTGTVRLRARAVGREWWTGYFAFNVYCGTVSGGPYYQVAPQTLSYTMDNNTVSRDANGFVTLTLTGTNTMGMTNGDTITVAGAAGCTDNPNGTFTIYDHTAVGSPASSSVTFKHAGAVESGCGGAAIVVSRKTAIGLSAHANAHYVLGDFIFTSIPGSGTQPPVTNTAAIDDVQVAVNAACDYSFAATTGKCQKTVQLGLGNDTASGVSQYTLTTPLILVEGSIRGHSGTPLTDTATGTRLFCGTAGNPLWDTDGEKVGCVMVVPNSTGVRMDGVSILSNSHSVMLLHGVGGAAAGNQIYFSRGVWNTQGANCVAPVRIMGPFYYLEFEKIERVAGSTTDCFSSAGKPRSASLMVSNMSGGTIKFIGPNRVTVPAKADYIQNRKGPTDPDRGANAAGFPAMATLRFEDEQMQATGGGGTGIICRCENTQVSFIRSPQPADLSLSAGTDPLYILGLDKDGTGSSHHFYAEGMETGASSNSTATFQLRNQDVPRLTFVDSVLSSSSGVIFDFNSKSVPAMFFGTVDAAGIGLCDPRNTAYFTNRVTTAGSGNNAIQCFGDNASATADRREGPHLYMQGGIVRQGWNATPANARLWGAWTPDGGTRYCVFKIDPDTTSQKMWCEDVATGNVEFYGSDGTTVIARTDRTNGKWLGSDNIWRAGFNEVSPSVTTVTIPLPVPVDCQAGITVNKVSVTALTQGTSTMTFNVIRYNSAGASQGNIFSGTQTYNNAGNVRQDFTATTTTATATDFFRLNVLTVNGQADVTFMVEGRCGTLP